MSVDPTLSTEGRPALRIERTYPHPIDKVWRAVSTAEDLSAWFPSPVEVDLRPGGTLRFLAFGDGQDSYGRIEQCEPPRLLSFLWGEDRLTFELAPASGGTRFTLTHAFDDRQGAASFAAGWEGCLAALTAVLLDQPMPAPDRRIERHEELVTRFGLGAPEVVEDRNGWAVRVERQLTCPAEVAWDLWFGKDIHTGEQRPAPPVGEPLTPYHAPDQVIGTMTEVDPYRMFAFAIAAGGGPGDHLRLELNPGAGHGARLVLTVTGTDPSERDQAAQMWGAGAIGHLAKMAAEWALENAA